MRTHLALSLALALVLCASAAQAAPQCAAHQLVVDQLATKYGEARHSMGMAANATLMELYTSPETGTWTLLVTLPDGMTCLVAAGDNFRTAPEPVKGDPA